jgi:colanic acid biosynthesis glycosyl transferase WcaI
VLACERWLLRRFDRVSTISERMLDRARGKGIENTRLLSLPNWVDISAIRPLQHPSRFRAELGIPDDAIVALYSGNMGGKQGLEVLADAALRLRNEPAIHFVFCGNGPARTDLMQRCADLANVRFIDLQPLDRLGDLLGLADIHLLPQRADAADLVMPSKLTGMLSSGRPVIATAHADTELGKVVMQCGSVVEPEDAAALADRIRWLATRPEVRREMGLRARDYAEKKLSREAVLAQLERDLADCLK